MQGVNINEEVEKRLAAMKAGKPIPKVCPMDPADDPDACISCQ